MLLLCTSFDHSFMRLESNEFLIMITGWASGSVNMPWPADPCSDAVCRKPNAYGNHGGKESTRAVGMKPLRYVNVDISLRSINL